ncbi:MULTISPECIES: hypothetical protein [unclassified Tolypothrix]|uniref:hypothetical protein n=1 Tax=unclassified Tolypothrix TaxID=2649714 RepID=UPI0005EAAA3B|nr:MULTISPECIES: hypothetical protein [unclassified Tolypothrix]BAY91686.1 hypothetical protein NIES3275_37110 [Microchaete diplosiphon NIES-3275]EKF05192.1 hypothetical protein FDUTEX481_01362 [Tolypothrix sp. PCC 7601]MBE9084310.1 hypothetical protein [Tolypothrix sp. LEGE 11397]UYD25702.1 hypothetical protein HGR01_30920 [Tolypothrix sp. PCC 7712]UYD32057.1 hypothetical protein HG267_23615 [Tolypothrix sp. PCC 7601]
MTVPDQILKQLVDIIHHPPSMYEQPPYNLDWDTKDAYFDRVITDFQGAETFDLFPDHAPGSWLIEYPFGEGFTSFFHLFIYLKEGGSQLTITDENRVEQIIHGIVLEINRDAPIAVYSAGYSRQVYKNGVFVTGTVGFVDFDWMMLDQLPAGEWQAQLAEATDILAQHGIFVLKRSHFERALLLNPVPEVTPAELFVLWFYKEL